MNKSPLSEIFKILKLVISEDVPSVLTIVALLEFLIVPTITPGLVLGVSGTVLVIRIIDSFNNEESDSEDDE